MKADRRLRTIENVVDAHLCTGCGACAYLAPDKLQMIDIRDRGRRPLPIASVNGKDQVGVEACPGAALRHDKTALVDAPFGGEWGPVLDLYECWATDDAVRHRGSSGGVVTALTAHAVGSRRMAGVLQIRARSDQPLANETVLSTAVDEIVQAAGSRYSPASPCERLDLIENTDEPCVFVGKPCDVAAATRASESRPALKEKLGLTIGIFCAGTPSTRGTEELLDRLGVDSDEVDKADYRGEGWPGRFRIRRKDGEVRSLSYSESWDETLRKHRQWRCMICPDHTGEFADLSVGDPWYRTIADNEPGRSLVVVRTERGRAALETALNEGALAGGPIPLERLPESQPNLATVRGSVWARVLAMRVAGLPTPKYQNMPAFRQWLSLGLRTKIVTLAGTFARIRRKRLRTPESQLY